MIKIYSEKEFDKKYIKQVKENEEIWDFCLEDLDYLLEEHNEEEFILIDKRLYEKF